MLDHCIKPAVFFKEYSSQEITFDIKASHAGYKRGFFDRLDRM